MTLHHTDFVSTLYAERANILSAQGLLSKRLVALDELLAVYGAKHVPGEDSIVAHAQEPQPEVTTRILSVSGHDEVIPASEVTTSDPPLSETPAPLPGSEAVASDADAAPAGEASRPDASPAPVLSIVIAEKAPDPAPAGEPSTSPAPTSTRQRVKQLHDEHPEYTRREAWEALGITEGSLAGHSHALGIRWKPLEPVRFERPAPPPPPEDAIAPDETVTPSNGFSAPRPSRPKGTQFRLRAGRGEGKYLHMSGIGMTDNKTYAWIGTESQLVAVRRKFPEARELYEEVVEKEPAR